MHGGTGPTTPARRLVAEHLVGGEPTAGQEIALRVDQTLTHDATGTLVMQELAFGRGCPLAQPRQLRRTGG